jgi:SPOR domain
MGLAAIWLLSACSPDRDWQAALKRDTIDGYKNFLEQHRDSPYNALAEQRISALKELQSWTTAQRLDSVASYQAYLAAFPNGLYVPIATKRMEVLNKGDDGSSDIPAALVPSRETSKPTPAAGEPASKLPATTQPSPSADAATLGATSASKPPQAVIPAESDAASQHGNANSKPTAPSASDKPSSANANKGHLVRAQIGVFSKHEGAESARNQAQNTPHSGSVSFSLVEIDRGDHKLWRVVSNPIERDTASATCDAIRKHNLDCVLISP